MLNAPGRSFLACSDVIPVAKYLVGVVELALLSAHAPYTPLPEPDVSTHAGRASGLGGRVALETPLPAQLEGTCIGWTFGLCCRCLRDCDRCALVSGLDSVDVEAVVAEISERSPVTMKRIMMISELCTQIHRKVGIVEDGLGMDEIHQVVVLEVSGIVEWYCIRLGDGRTTNRFLGAASPRSRYVRELESSLMHEQGM